MKRRTRRALATTVLAAALLAAPAAPASQEILRALDLADLRAVWGQREEDSE